MAVGARESECGVACDARLGCVLCRCTVSLTLTGASRKSSRSRSEVVGLGAAAPQSQHSSVRLPCSAQHIAYVQKTCPKRAFGDGGIPMSGADACVSTLSHRSPRSALAYTPRRHEYPKLTSHQHAALNSTNETPCSEQTASRKATGAATPAPPQRAASASHSPHFTGRRTHCSHVTLARQHVECALGPCAATGGGYISVGAARCSAIAVIAALALPMTCMTRTA